MLLQWLKRKFYKNRQLLYVTHPECTLHDPGEEHPDHAQRLLYLDQYIRTSDLFKHIQYVNTPEKASIEQLSKVHTEAYLSFLENITCTRGRVALDNDTIVNAHSFEAARYASGSVIFAVDQVCTQQAPRAFCAIRPPGHHAMQNQARGFCLINNVSVGVAYALEQYCIERVAIVDFDVHHGDGTESIWKNHSKVALFSLFEEGLFAAAKNRTTEYQNHTLPIKAHTSREFWQKTVVNEWLPALHSWSPQIIFISAGFDGHRDENIAHLNFEEQDYFWLTEQIVQVAKTHGNGKVISVLEGGYVPEILAQSVRAHLLAMLN